VAEDSELDASVPGAYAYSKRVVCSYSRSLEYLQRNKTAIFQLVEPARQVVSRSLPPRGQSRKFFRLPVTLKPSRSPLVPCCPTHRRLSRIHSEGPKLAGVDKRSCLLVMGSDYSKSAVLYKLKNTSNRPTWLATARLGRLMFIFCCIALSNQTVRVRRN